MNREERNETIKRLLIEAMWDLVDDEYMMKLDLDFGFAIASIDPAFLQWVREYKAEQLRDK